MKLVTRVGVLALALVLVPIGAIAAFADNSPQVELATPGIGDGAIERFTVRFNQPMVTLGDPRAASPFDVKCPVEGEGRWVDQTTFVHEFENPLPGGVTCTFTLKEKLKSLGGYELSGQKTFTVDTGGPIARAVLPSRYGGEIEEDQVFLVASNWRSIAPRSRPTPIARSTESARRSRSTCWPPTCPRSCSQILARIGGRFADFLSEAGLPEALPAAAADRSQGDRDGDRAQMPPPVAARPRHGAGLGRGDHKPRRPPRRRRPALRFHRAQAVRRALRLLAGQSRRPGAARSRTRIVRFTAPIPRAQAEAIRIKLTDGTELSPVFTDEEKRAATIASVKFKAPLPPATAAKLMLPAGVDDESGRKLANAERFPLDVRFDEPPPLVKFAAPFGILEAKEGGVLPVTVRNVEPALKGTNLAGRRAEPARRRIGRRRGASGCARVGGRRQRQVRRGQARQGQPFGSTIPAPHRSWSARAARRCRSACRARARNSRWSASR